MAAYRENAVVPGSQPRRLVVKLRLMIAALGAEQSLGYELSNDLRDSDVDVEVRAKEFVNQFWSTVVKNGIVFGPPGTAYPLNQVTELRWTWEVS